MNYSIYNIRNLLDNKIYIGSSCRTSQRKRQHFYKLKKNIHSNKKLQNAYNKYGCNNFIFEIIECVFDKNELVNKEQKWIDFFKPEYNIRLIAQSNKGLKLSEEHKRKIGDKSRGNKHRLGAIIPPDVRKKMSLIKIGKKKSQKTKENMSIAQKGRIVTIPHRKKISLALIGRKLTPETIQKLKKRIPWNKGRVGCYSEEHLLKLKNSHLGKKQSINTIRKRTIKLIGNKHRSGKKLSQEHIQKIINANTGKKYCLGRKWTKEERAKRLKT